MSAENPFSNDPIEVIDQGIILPSNMGDHIEKWVVIREGEIILSSEESEDAFNSADWGSGDFIFFVPDPNKSHIFSQNS